MSNAPARAPIGAEALVDRAGLSDEERRLGAEARARYAELVQDVVVHRAVESPRVTLVIVSYKAQDYLLDCLKHLVGQTVRGAVPYEILLADSGGLEHLRDRYAGLVDVDLRLQPGLPLNAARNAAMAWARGEIVAFIDDDGRVEPDWVEEALAVFADPAAVAARGRIVPYEHPYFNAFVVHYDRGADLWDDESLGTEGNLAIRRLSYLAVGGFPDEFYGAEGSYLGHQLKKRFPTQRTLYAPRMVMRHDYCRSAREFVWKARKYRTTRKDATAEDPEFRAFMQRYLSKPKPVQPMAWDEALARRLLRWSARVIEKAPFLDHVKRR